MIILQEVVVVTTPGLHHEAVLHIHHEGVLHIQVGLVPLIIRAMAVLHIRVKVVPHIVAVHPVATETTMGIGIIHHQAEISAIITITHLLCVQVAAVTGHHILGVVWILHQVITMTDMDPLHPHIAMIGVPHLHLMDIILPLLLLKEVVVDIMVVVVMVVTVVVMVVTEVALLPLLLHHITIPRGGTEHLKTIFANFVVKLSFTFIVHVC